MALVPDSPVTARAEVSSRRIITAISWNTVSTGSVTLIQVLRSVALARLLTPDAYGLFGMAGVVTVAVAALTNVNATASLIARSDTLADNRNVIDSIWTFDIIRQSIVTCLLLAAAYPSALYFGDRRVTAVLLITAFIPAISSLTNIGLTLMRKQIDFRTVGLHRLSAEVAVTVLSIGLALATRNVWALVFGQLAGAMIGVALSYWFHPYRPRLHYDRAALAGSVGFTKSLFVITLLTFITTQFDQLVVGKYMGTAVLGAYLLAYRLATMPVDILTEIVGNVMFPAFAGLTRPEMRERVEQALIGTFAATAFALSAVLLPMRLASTEIIAILYGKQWGQAAPVLEALALVGLFRGLTRVFSPLMLGFGRADLEAKIKTVEAAMFIPLTITLLLRWGVVGAAWAGVFTYFVAVSIRLIFATRLLPGSARRLMIVVLTAAVVTVTCYAAATVLINAGMPAPLASVLLVIALAAVTYLSQPQIRRTVAAVARAR